jgi:transcriptional regulator with XRE-family HTH domain
MSSHQHTSVRSRRVATELRRLRESSGLSCEDVADRLGIPVSRVRRLEAGGTGLQLADVEAMLDLYDVPAERRADLLIAARQSLRHTWWAQLAGQPCHWRSLQHLESSASRVRDCQPFLLPCLLRTTDYGHAVLADDLVARSAEQVDRLVGLQEARQAVLDRPDGPALHAIVGEHAVTWLGHDEPVSRGQLRHLLAVSERPNVTLQVIPNSVGTHAGTGGAFTMMDFGADDTVVYTERFVTGTYYQTRSAVAVYDEIMTGLLTHALSPAATRDFLHGLASG